MCGEGEGGQVHLTSPRFGKVSVGITGACGNPDVSVLLTPIFCVVVLWFNHSMQTLLLLLFFFFFKDVNVYFHR